MTFAPLRMLFFDFQLWPHESVFSALRDGHVAAACMAAANMSLKFIKQQINS